MSSCRAPKIYSQPYMVSTTAPSTSNDRYSLMQVHDAEVFAAVEIDCSSEIDCCIVKHSGGFAFVSVGAPAIGPLTGPLDIMPWRRVMPYGPDVQSFTFEPLVSAPPLLAVKVHYQMPMVCQTRRAPTVRRAPTFPAGAAYGQAAEFPLYGLLRARLSITALGFSCTYKVEGVHYLARDAGTEANADPISTTATPLFSQLLLDGAGSLERTVAAGVTEPLDVIEEPFDTVVVSVKQGSGAGSAKLLWRAEG